MVGSLLVLLAEGICTFVWECRLPTPSRTSANFLKHRLTGAAIEQNLPSSISASPPSQQQLGTEEISKSIPTSMPRRGASHYFYSFPRGDGNLPPTYTVRWNQLTLARPQGLVGQLFRQPQQQGQSVGQPLQQYQQHPLFLDVTESTSGVNTPSTSTQPPSDVV